MKKKVHLGLVFKDFACWVRSSCVGLHVAGFATAEVLRQHGIDVSVFPVRHNVDIVHAIDRYNRDHVEPLTHVVISAPWLSRRDLESLIGHFWDIKFVILSHSNVGFLQADPDGVRLLREYASLAKKHENLHVGGNSAKFVKWFHGAYGGTIKLLPNMYPMQKSHRMKRYEGGVLKIGAFGAVRPYKNFMTAAGAALLIHRELGVPVEFHMSSGGEGDGFQTIPAIQQMLVGTDVELILHNWSYWDDFVKVVGEMDLLMQPSYTESFNMVVADAIFAGVPAVVSTAVCWAPASWKADSDNAGDVAAVGTDLLKGKFRQEGRKALIQHNESALDYWKKFLGCDESWDDKIADWLGF